MHFPAGAGPPDSTASQTVSIQCLTWHDYVTDPSLAFTQVSLHFPFLICHCLGFFSVTSLSPRTGRSSHLQPSPNLLHVPVTCLSGDVTEEVVAGAPFLGVGFYCIACAGWHSSNVGTRVPIAGRSLGMQAVIAPAWGQPEILPVGQAQVALMSPAEAPALRSIWKDKSSSWAQSK